MQVLRASVALAGLLLVACNGRTTPESAAKAPVKTPPPDAIRVHALEAYGFDRVADLKKANVIAVVSVVGQDEKRVRVSAVPDEGHKIIRFLELQLESVIRGSARDGGTFHVQNLGWFETEEGRRPFTYDGYTWLDVGDRALVALIGDGSEPSDDSAMLTNDAVLFLKNGEVQDTPRRKPVIRELESLTEAELRDRVERDAG